KIRDQRQAMLLALPGMELRPYRGVARDDRRDRPAVVGLSNEAILVRVELIRVHEIAVQTGGPKRDPLKQRVGTPFVQGVPAHVRDLQIRTGWRDAVDLAG